MSGGLSCFCAMHRIKACGAPGPAIPNLFAIHLDTSCIIRVNSRWVVRVRALIILSSKSANPEAPPDCRANNKCTYSGVITDAAGLMLACHGRALTNFMFPIEIYYL